MLAFCVTRGSACFSATFSFSHPLLPPLCPQVCSLCLRLYCCPTNRFVSTIFLDYSTYMCEYAIFVFLSYFTLYNRLWVHPPHYHRLKFVPFYGREIFHCIYVPQFFIHSSVDGTSRLLPGLDVLATVNSAALNTRIHMSFRIVVFSGYVGPVVGLLGHMVILFLVFKEISKLFSLVAVSIYIPTNCRRGFPFLYTSSSIYCL